MLGLSILALACSAWTAAPQSSPTRTLRNAKVGYSLVYPPGWRIAGRVQATAFAVGADCGSVRIVDLRPPENSGPGATVLQSFVQTCWKRVSDGLSLEGFMRATYGSRLSASFEQTRLGGARAYRARDGGDGEALFLQTGRYRLQVVTAVVAAPAKRMARLAQVRKILASFSLIR